jgi:hypothetical protein
MTARCQGNDIPPSVTEAEIIILGWASCAVDAASAAAFKRAARSLYQCGVGRKPSDDKRRLQIVARLIDEGQPEWAACVRAATDTLKPHEKMHTVADRLSRKIKKISVEKVVGK